MIFSDFLALGPLFGGIAGLLQLSLLPGLLVLHLLARRQITLSAPSAALFVFSCSLVLTFMMILVLHALGLHARWVWWLLGLAQILALGYLLTGQQATVGQPPTASAVSNPGVYRVPALHVLFAASYLLYCLWFTLQLLAQWPAAFEAWDTVINWNRWALDWTHGEWPVLTWGYPQLLPASWSLVYLWQGSTETEFLLRAWLGLFPVAFALLCFDMFLRWRQVAPLLAGAALLLLLGSSFVQVLDSGYADVPVSLFVLLTGHWVLCAVAERGRDTCWLAFATVACAAALLTKQGGVLALPILAWGLWACRYQRSRLLQAVILLPLLVLPWYLLQWFNGTGGDVSGYVTSAIYGGETLPARFWRALTVTLPNLLFPGVNSMLAHALLAAMLLALGSALRDARGRFCTTVGLVWLLLWALYFSYDGRNLLPGLPFLLLAVAIGVEPLLNLAGSRLRQYPMPGLPRIALPVRLPPILLALPLVLALLPGSAERWERLTNDLRKQSGDPALNQQLIAYVSAAEFSGKIYTTYPQLAAITELRPHLFADFGATHMQTETIAALLAGQPFCRILATFPRHTTVSHLLLHVTVYPALVAAALSDGSLQERFSTADQRLMQVHCPPSTPVGDSAQ